MKGLMIALGKPSDSDKEKGGDAADEYAREVYSALQDKDEDGFVEALKSFVGACSHKDDEDEG